jgi:hypothetical protein
MNRNLPTMGTIDVLLCLLFIASAEAAHSLYGFGMAQR